MIFSTFHHHPQTCSISTIISNKLQYKKIFFIISFLFSVLFARNEAASKITAKPCSNALGEIGTCMFAWECIQSDGKRLGTCADGFLFGSCCGLPTTVREIEPSGHLFPRNEPFVPTKPVPVTTRSPSNKRTSTTPPYTYEKINAYSVKLNRSSPTVSHNESDQANVIAKNPTAPIQSSNDSHFNYASFSLIKKLNDNGKNSKNLTEEKITPETVPLNPSNGFNEATTVPEVFETPSSSFTTKLPENVLNENLATVNSDIVTEESNDAENDVTTEGSDKLLTTMVDSTEKPMVQTTVTGFPIETMDGSELATLIQLLTTMSSVTTDSSTYANNGQDKKPATSSVNNDFLGTTMTNNIVSNSEATTMIPTSPSYFLKGNFSVPVQAEMNEPVDNNTISSHVINQSSSTQKYSPEVTSTRPYINKLDCGHRPLKPRESRVVGGRNAFFGEWPWQVLIKEATWLGLFVKTKCGGVLIDHKWVLTAAHCQPGFLGSLVVIVGEYDLTGDFENLKPVAKPVRRMIVHRNYKPDTFENDIALLELESAFEVQPHVIPICLPDAEDTDDYVGLIAHVAGWGKLSYGGPVPSILQVVKLPIIPNNQCQKMFQVSGHHKIIRNTFICAGYTDGGKDSCEGDSGGPLMVQKDGRWTLIGTVSHGIKCAEPNLPGVYMRTSTYMPWISSILRRHYD